MNRLLQPERRTLLLAAAAIVITATMTLSAPAVMARAIDGPLARGDYGGILRHAAVLLAMYVVALLTQYRQSFWMGSVGQRVLHRLRGEVFRKLQELPIAFFAARRTGDVISRINNDTDKMYQFFSQSLMQFVGSFVTMAGSAVFLLSLNPRLGTAALAPALVMFLLTRCLTPWLKRRNAATLESLGKVSAEVSESLSHFQVLVAFDRRDAFRREFEQVNEHNYQQALKAGLANGVLGPLYSLCSQLAQLIVLSYGLALVARGDFTVGLLIGYFIYVNRFYDPMRQLGALWASFQAANAAYDRISEILSEKMSLEVMPCQESPAPQAGRLEFCEVDFGYRAGQEVLSRVSFRLEPGKTYAFVGPTGGGKTTTASLMSRLYDPKGGKVLFDGRDLRSYPAQERSEKVGVILQEPFLFEPSVGDNVESLAGVEHLFPEGLQTPVGELSLGQRQVVAFLRAVSRKPQLLILDEATANIDTVTERILESLLGRLPEDTTKVVIAHRLNTIAKADVIYFVNGGRVQLAGSMEQAVALLRQESRRS